MTEPSNTETHRDSAYSKALRCTPTTAEVNIDSGVARLSIKHLSEISGVGEKVRRTLIDHFGSESVALKVVLDSRVDLVAAVPGIGARQAVNIVKAAFEHQFGASANKILKTPDVRKIFNSILDIIGGYANTSYAKQKLLLYFPLPPDKLDIILERQKYFTDAAELASTLTEQQRTSIGELLSQMRGLYSRTRHRRLEGRVVITNDEKSFDKLINEGVDKWCPVYILSEGENVKDYSKGYDLVLFISPLGIYDDSVDMLDNVEILGKGWTIDDILPERTIGFYARNYKVIDSACQLVEIFEKLPSNNSVDEFRKNLDFENLKSIGEILKKLNEDGTITDSIDAELDRFRKAVKTFHTAVAETESWINEQIKARIEKSKVTIGGAQIISILQSADVEGSDASALRNMLPAEIIETFSSTIQEAEDNMAKMLGLRLRESDWVSGIVSDEISLPVKMVLERINELEDRLRRIFADKEFSLIKKIASELDALRNKATEAVQTLLEFDLFLAVGLFACDYKLRAPEISMEYSGVGMQGARNVFLVESWLKGRHGEVQPIDYTIGDNPFRPDGSNGESCVVLSGANSGGKTTTIKTLAQLVTMAQAGFPVPAEKSYLPIFEEIYVFEKGRGMISAGAFETTLKQFAEIVVSEKHKLVLFDEVEAITEPGSAANVIAGLLEILHKEPNSCTVICSHVAQEIQKLVEAPIRIDGIEARGLNENLDLIVDRTPRFGYLAKSTPELIVERLAKLTKGKKKDVYFGILKKLTSDRS
jgi:energy-coupling factor transporter ATP-binding protein EcfA2